MGNIKTKICSKCNAEKDVSLFGSVKVLFKSQLRLIIDDCCKSCIGSKLGLPKKELSERPVRIKRIFRTPEEKKEMALRRHKKWLEKKLIECPEYKEVLNKRSRNIIRNKYQEDEEFRERMLQKGRELWRSDPEHKRKRQEYSKKWHDNNAENRKIDYVNNKDEIIKRNLAYYESNKDKCKKRFSDYYQRNKEQFKIKRKEKYEKEKEAKRLLKESKNGQS